MKAKRPSDLLELIQWEREDRLRTIRETGEEPVDLWGRPRADIAGDGPEACLARAIYPRNRRKALPESEGFGLAKFRQLYKAIAFANLQGWVLNTFVTVSWATVGIADDAAVNTAHKALVRRIREWCTERKVQIPFVLIWVKERSERLGVHSHLLLHVASHERARLGHVIKEFVSKHAGRPVVANHALEDGTVLSTVYTDGPRVRGESQADQLHLQWRVFRYLMKGATAQEWIEVLTPAHARILFKEYARVAVRAQGKVAGKRVGTSTASLGHEAWQVFAEEHGLGVDWLDEHLRKHGPTYDDQFLREGEWRASSRRIDLVYGATKSRNPFDSGGR